MRLHIHLPSAKSHAFGFKTEALLDGRISAQFDFSSRSQYALPGQAEAAIQDARH